LARKPRRWTTSLSWWMLGRPRRSSSSRSGRPGWDTHNEPPRRLKVSVAARDVCRLASYPAPVYLVGIGEEQECGFLLAVLSGSTSAIPSLPTRFPLDCANLRLLYDEVSQFWSRSPASLTGSAFVA